MTHRDVANHTPKLWVVHDLEALGLAAGILILILCLVATIWPEAI